MSTVATLLVIYYVVNVITTWYYAGTRKSIEYTPGLAVIATIIMGLVVWGILSLDGAA
jgi:hypothetical protein